MNLFNDPANIRLLRFFQIERSISARGVMIPATLVSSKRNTGDKRLLMLFKDTGFRALLHQYLYHTRRATPLRQPFGKPFCRRRFAEGAARDSDKVVMPTWMVERKLEGSFASASAAAAPGRLSSAHC
jgi:hypothetical protein